MVQYIKEIVAPLREGASKNEFGPMDRLLPALCQEIQRLDPRDFLPRSQAPLVHVRAELDLCLAALKHRRSAMRTEIVACCDRLPDILDDYAGENSRAISRTFPFVRDPALRAIIERDYRELALILVPSGAWKSAVVLAGSIVEAVLTDALATDPNMKARAEASRAAPRDKRTGTVRDLDAGKWTLHDLIEVATDLGLIGSARSPTFDVVLRDYRNFVHPKREVRAGHPCTEAEAYMAKGALDALCNSL